MKARNLGIGISLLAATFAYGSRMLMTPPLEASSVQYTPSRVDNRGPTAGACNVRFRMVNMGSITQTVSIQLLDESFEYSTQLLNRSGFSGWSTLDGTWITTKNVRASSDTKTVKVDPLKPALIFWSAYQRGTLTASSGFNWDSPTIAAPPTEFHASETGTCGAGDSDAKETNKICAAVVTSSVRAKITVEEDLGAVAGSVILSCALSNGTGEIRLDSSEGLNGGRPF